MTTYFKLVKGATKIKMAPPKQKYIDPILLGTSDSSEFMEIMKALESRISDTAWTIVYKSLIVIHLMMRDGDRDVTIKYLSHHLEFFQLRDVFHSKLSSGDLQALKRYNEYLKCRCEEFGKIGKDYVRDGNSNLKSATKNPSRALNHVESLELQITALIKNRYSQYDLNNDLLMFAFKLLVQDLLVLYNSLNEGIITLLEGFFELTHKDAERTLELYKRFVELTENVVKYLKAGKAVGLKIPVIKHITTKLIRSLEEHLREDEKNGHQTFNNASSESAKSSAQKQLEQVREQKRLLEEQLRTQQHVTISPTIPQQQTGYNPFGESFTFEQPQQLTQQQPQQSIQTHNTSNPFITQQLPTQTTQAFAQQPTQAFNQQSTQTFVQQPAHAFTQPQLQQQQQLKTEPTGFYSSHTQITPNFTGAGFGGYTMQLEQQQQQQQQKASTVSSASLAQQQQPMKTGSNNPFSLDNITKHKETRELVNPFSQTNFNGEGGNPHHQQLGTPFGQQQPQQPQQPSINPFGAQEQQQQPQLQQTGYQPTFGGLEKLPTVSVFPQTQQNPQTQQITSVTPAQYEPQQQTNSTNSMQFVPQQTGFNPFMQPTQQFQPQPQYQQTYSQQPNQNLQTVYTQQQLQQQQLQLQQQQQRPQQYYTEGPNLIDI